MLKSIGLKAVSYLSRLLRKTPLGRSDALGHIHAVMSLYLNGTNEATVGEFKVRFDSRDRYIAKKLILYGGYETEDIRMFCSLVREGDAVMDVGANIGLYSLALSRAVGAHGSVIAVEPDPDNVRILNENLSANSCSNVTVLPFALSDQEGTINLFQVDGNRGWLSFADLGNTGRSIPVAMKRGEDALSTLSVKPSILKIDVEGAEPLVMAGLGYNPDIILFEFVPAQLEALKQSPLDFLQSLENRGYALGLSIGGTLKESVQGSASILEYVRHHPGDHNILAAQQNDFARSRLNELGIPRHKAS